MYFNEKHNQIVINRGDNYIYIGSYRKNEETLDGKNKKHNANYIRVQCPYCNKKYDVALSGFKRGNSCSHCCNSYINSFAYHIQVELGEGLNKYWDWEKNTVNPYLISKSKNDIKIWIKCTKTDYHESYPILPYNFIRGNRCPYCSTRRGKVHPKDSFAQWGINTFGKDFLDKYWSPKNTLNPWQLTPQSSNEVWILCQDKDYHNSDGGYLITVSNFYAGTRCGYCNSNGKKVHPKDSFGSLYPLKAKYWSEKNDKSPYEVAPKSGDTYKFICQECGEEFERDLNHLNRSNYGLFCINCNNSQLEETTKQVLQKYNIKYISQMKYNNLLGLGGGNLSYDFYLPDYNVLIECQGIQHEKYTKGFHKTKKDFEKQLEHDRRKREYATDHKIKLLEIWYNEIDKIEDILIEELNLKYNN